jgi:hypothetical protein
MDVLLEGQKIRHELYGEGVVLESDEERTTIEFDDHGEKKFVTSLMTCQVIGEAPKKKTRGRRRKARSVAVETRTQDAAA